jgi:hypothetical protein
MEESSIHANELTRVGYLVFNMKFLNKLMKVSHSETFLSLLTICRSMSMKLGISQGKRKNLKK